jgi:hypothetical protein
MRVRNSVRQIGQLKHLREGSLAAFTKGRIRGFLFQSGDSDEVLILPSCSAPHWNQITEAA